jgi:hypothetical protein
MRDGLGTNRGRYSLLITIFHEGFFQKGFAEAFQEKSSNLLENYYRHGETCQKDA